LTPDGTADSRPLGQGAAPSQTLPRRGGRPAPAPHPEVALRHREGKKWKRLSVRLLPEEWDFLRGQAEESGMVLSDYVRVRMGTGDVKENKKRILGKKQEKNTGKKNKEEYREIAAQIAKVGNNVNQLARWANTFKSAADAVRVVRVLAGVMDKLEEIIEMVRGA